MRRADQGLERGGNVLTASHPYAIREKRKEKKSVKGGAGEGKRRGKAKDESGLSFDIEISTVIRMARSIAVYLFTPEYFGTESSI